MSHFLRVAYSRHAKLVYICIYLKSQRCTIRIIPHPSRESIAVAVQTQQHKRTTWCQRASSHSSRSLTRSFVRSIACLLAVSLTGSLNRAQSIQICRKNSAIISSNSSSQPLQQHHHHRRRPFTVRPFASTRTCVLFHVCLCRCVALCLQIVE